MCKYMYICVNKYIYIYTYFYLFISMMQHSLKTSVSVKIRHTLAEVVCCSQICSVCLEDALFVFKVYA